MLTVAKLKSMTGKGEPYQQPLRCVVASSLQPTSYVKDGMEKRLQNLVVCDTTGFIKVTSFNVAKTEDLPPKSTIVMKNFISKPASIIITEKTQVFKCATLHVSDDIVNEAVNHLRPPTPPVIPIKEAKLSPLKSIQSVAGRITQDETPREVVVKGSPVQVRTVTLQDKEDRVKLALWRKLADENIKAGDYVNVSNVLITSYQDHVELASTSRTKVEVATPPEEALSLTVLGFESYQDKYDLLCQIDGENIATFTCPLNLLDSLLANEDLNSDPDDETDYTSFLPLEERVMKSLPGLCHVMCQDTMITAITKPLQKLN